MILKMETFDVLLKVLLSQYSPGTEISNEKFKRKSTSVLAIEA
jgi:hypothetical protein